MDALEKLRELAALHGKELYSALVDKLDEGLKEVSSVQAEAVSMIARGGHLKDIIEKAPVAPSNDEYAAALKEAFFDAGAPFAQLDEAARLILSSLGLDMESVEYKLPSGEETIGIIKEGAEKGNTNAQITMAIFYINGQNGIARNLEEARRLVDLAAETGSSEAFYLSGVLDLASDPPNEESALKAFIKAASAGNIKGSHQAGLLYETGSTIPRSVNQAMKHYRTAAGRGYAPSQTALGRIYQSLKDYKKALSWYEKAVALGDGNAMYSIASLSSKKLIPGASVELTTSWLEKGAQARNIPSIISLGSSYLSRPDKASQSAALKYFSMGASMGDASCEYYVSMIHMGNSPVAKGFETGMHWLEQSASKGYLPAIHRLGEIFESLRTEDGYKEAARLFTIAVNSGYADSCVNLANLYENGLGVEKKPQTAISLCKLAADAGHEQAKAKLASLEQTVVFDTPVD
jgi:TPR repeat protein